MKNLRQSKNSNVKQKILIFITALIITMSLVKLADILLGYVNKDMEDNSSSTMRVAILTISIFSGVTSPITLVANAGPGNGIRRNKISGKPSASATFLTPSFLSWTKGSIIL